MEKVYSRINWQNQPSTATALGATNLNKMDLALNEIDDRVIQFEISKLGMDQANTMVKDMSLDPLNGILRITKLDGTVTSYDTKLEKLAINFEYDNINERLVITLDDGTKQYVDMSSLISEQNFNDSDTIAFSKVNGNVSATVKNGSIKPAHMQGDYLAAITQQALNSAESAQQSHDDALISQRFAVGGVVEGDATDNAKYYKEQAKAYADQAQMVTDITIASNEKAGIVKSGSDINVDTQGNVTLNTVFDVLAARANIASGDTVATILAKIQKYFLDIQPHAYIEKITEQYLDTLVTNKINQAIQNSAIIHNLATSNASMVLGADVGPVIAQNLSSLQSQIDTQNNNLTALTNRVWNYLPVGSTQTTLVSYVLNNMPYGGTIAFPGGILTDLPLNAWGVAEVVRHAAAIWSVTIHFAGITTLYYNQIYVDHWSWSAWVEK